MTDTGAGLWLRYQPDTLGQDTWSIVLGKSTIATAWMEKSAKLIVDAVNESTALRTQLEAAEREVAQLKGFREISNSIAAAIDRADKAESQLARANALADAERKDAERYRWLREQNTVMYEKQNIIVFWDGPKELDAAIDDVRPRQAAAEKSDE